MKSNRVAPVADGTPPPVAGPPPPSHTPSQLATLSKAVLDAKSRRKVLDALKKGMETAFPCDRCFVHIVDEFAKEITDISTDTVSAFAPSSSARAGALGFAVARLWSADTTKAPCRAAILLLGLDAHCRASVSTIPRQDEHKMVALRLPATNGGERSTPDVARHVLFCRNYDKCTALPVPDAPPHCTQ